MAREDREMDSEMASAITAIESPGLPPWHALSVTSARRIENDVFSSGGGPELDSVRELRIPGPGGDLPIRVYRPTTERSGALVFYHGGGWTLGTLDPADTICRELSSRAGCPVASVDYRLAPEHPFPAAPEDAFAALRWVVDYGEALGVDASRLGVAGTSAGGALAAGAAVRARNVGIDLDGQFLLYPITNHGFDTDSYRTHADAPLLSRADMRWFWGQYLRSPLDAHNPVASVLRAPDLAGTAPATVLTAGFDVLADDGRAYADRLADAGVPTDHAHYPTLAHGFLSLTDGVAVADAAMDELAGRIRARLD